MFDSKKCKFPQDLKALVIFALLSVIFIIVPLLNQTPLRTIFAIVLLLFIPGYAFIAALFPKKYDLSGIERFTLSIGFSIVITVFDGLAISMTHWYFRPNSISISLFVITLTFATIAYLLRIRLPENERFYFSYNEFMQSLKSNTDDNNELLKLTSSEKKQFKVKTQKKIMHWKHSIH